jgi:hypothetical protein
MDTHAQVMCGTYNVTDADATSRILMYYRLGDYTSLYDDQLSVNRDSFLNRLRDTAQAMYAKLKSKNMLPLAPPPPQLILMSKQIVTSAIPIFDAVQIVDLRNAVIHAYSFKDHICIATSDMPTIFEHFSVLDSSISEAFLDEPVINHKALAAVVSDIVATCVVVVDNNKAYVHSGTRCWTFHANLIPNMYVNCSVTSSGYLQVDYVQVFNSLKVPKLVVANFRFHSGLRALVAMFFHQIFPFRVRSLQFAPMSNSQLIDKYNNGNQITILFEGASSIVRIDKYDSYSHTVRLISSDKEICVFRTSAGYCNVPVSDFCVLQGVPRFIGNYEIYKSDQLLDKGVVLDCGCNYKCIRHLHLPSVNDFFIGGLSISSKYCRLHRELLFNYAISVERLKPFLFPKNLDVINSYIKVQDR